MALKACKVCKNQVAEDAPTCPDCGTPLPGFPPKKDENKDPKWTIFQIVSLVAISILSIKVILGSFGS